MLGYCNIVQVSTRKPLEQAVTCPAGLLQLSPQAGSRPQPPASDDQPEGFRPASPVQTPDFRTRPPVSPAFWNEYGRGTDSSEQPPRDTTPDVPPNRCTIDGAEPLPPVQVPPAAARAVPGISSHVLALLQQSGTSPEALAELAGITAPSPYRPGQQGAGNRDRTTGSARWDVEPAVCWAGVCGGHRPRSSMADQLEGRSQLPPSEQQMGGLPSSQDLRHTFAAEIDKVCAQA